MFNVFNSNIVSCLKICAPLKTVYIRNDKPKLNLKDDSFISKLFNPKTTERQKWNIKKSFGEAITNNFKLANFTGALRFF